jgi:hypothetical protein
VLHNNEWQRTLRILTGIPPTQQCPEALQHRYFAGKVASIFTAEEYAKIGNRREASSNQKLVPYSTLKMETSSLDFTALYPKRQLFIITAVTISDSAVFMNTVPLTKKKKRTENIGVLLIVYRKCLPYLKSYNVSENGALSVLSWREEDTYSVGSLRKS